MDQVKIGKFISEKRKAHGLTQKDLAEILYISDKTISKWECGKGLPEVSLMLPLCNALNITVNDLLSGEKISDVDYQREAEKNMMNLIKENEENKKSMLLAVICAVITIIAVCSLVIIAAYLNLSVFIRIAVITLAFITAVVGIGAAGMLEVKAGYYECPHCKTLFVPTMKEYVKGYHTFSKRMLTCHKCGKRAMCRHRIVR